MEPSSSASLDRYRVANGIASMFYIPGFLSPEQEQRYASRIRESRGWVALKGRRLIQFGGTPSEKMIATPLPSWIAEVASMLRDRNYCPDQLNHCLVNEYQPGQGIMAHEDGPLYTPHFAIVSLLSGITLNFYRNRTGSDDASSLEERFVTGIYLEPRSALIITGHAYTDYMHGIEEKMADELDPERISNYTGDCRTVPRELRISMTIRQVKRTVSASKLFGFAKK